MQGLPCETKGWLNKYVLTQLRLGKPSLANTEGGREFFRIWVFKEGDSSAG